jgi:hypothetical protein
MNLFYFDRLKQYFSLKAAANIEWIFNLTMIKIDFFNLFFASLFKNLISYKLTFTLF